MKTPATMYCEHCGASIEADSKFCAECGNKLHDTSVNQSQIQSEPPRENGIRSTRTPREVMGIWILIVLVGSLLVFFAVDKSTFTSTKSLPSDLPPLEKFAGHARLPLFDCAPGKVYYLRTYDYETADPKTAFVQLFIDFDLGGSAHPAAITKLTQSSQEWWVDLDREGVRYQYFDSEAAFKKRFGGNICPYLRHK